MDELLKMHSRFLQVSITSRRLLLAWSVTSASHRPPCRSSQDPDLHRVAAVMKEHTALVAEPQPSPSVDAPPHWTSDIWRRVYGVAPLSVSFIFGFKRRKPNCKTIRWKLIFVPLGSWRRFQWAELEESSPKLDQWEVIWVENGSLNSVFCEQWVSELISCAAQGQLGRNYATKSSLIPTHACRWNVCWLSCFFPQCPSVGEYLGKNRQRECKTGWTLCCN